MEKISIGGLPKGSTAKMKKKAKSAKCLKKNGEPHLSAWASKVLMAALDA